MPKEFQNDGKVVKLFSQGKIHFFRLRSCNLFFSENQCVMLTLQNITHIYELFEEKNKNKTQSILAASISHEVITPLSCISNFAQDCIGITKNKQCLRNL